MPQRTIYRIENCFLLKTSQKSTFQPMETRAGIGAITRYPECGSSVFTHFYESLHSFGVIFFRFFSHYLFHLIALGCVGSFYFGSFWPILGCFRVTLGSLRGRFRFGSDCICYSNNQRTFFDASVSPSIKSRFSSETCYRCLCKLPGFGT